MIYLDYAANSPICETALNTLYKTSAEFIGNPNSNHSEGRKARVRLAEATAKIAQLLNVKEDEIIYTSSASEANNLAIKGIANKYKRNGKHMITTYVEHSSLLGAIMGLADYGYEIDFVDLDENGQVDLAHLKELMREDTVLVSTSYVDSELGIIQPVSEIGKIVKEYPNCFYHVDATQAVAKIPLELEAADLITFTAHKFYGPNGVGALIKKENVEVAPMIEGGLSTTIYRSGTPTLALIASMEAALEETMDGLDTKIAHVEALNKKLRGELSTYSNVVINSTEKSSPYILNLSLKGMKSREFTKALDDAGICVSTKSACCPENAVSKPVYALTKDRKLAMNPLRISLSHTTTEAEVDAFLKEFQCIYSRLETR